MVESEEWFHGKEGVEVKTRDGVSGVKKHFLGVDKQGNRWRARARDPLLRADVYLGCYGTPEEAALVAKKKREEFAEMLKRQKSSSMGTCRGYFEGKKFHAKEGVEVETRDGVSGVKKRFLGVDKIGNRWRAQARNPLLRADVHLGCYGTPEEAALVAKKKRVEFEEMLKGQDSTSMGTCRGYFERKKFHGKEGVEVETDDGVSGVKKHFLGVDKQGNRWRARARDPLLRADVYLGCYGTPEEAALVAKKKRAEFEEMFKGLDSSSMGTGVSKKRRAEFEEMFEGSDNSSMGTCRGYFEGKKVPGGWGVRRNRVHIRHPKSKNLVSGGSYRACEDVAIVADKKREEFQEIYRGKVGKLIVMSGDAKVAPVVKRIQSGKWVARIKKPESKDRIWLGAYNTLEEAVSSYNEKKAEFDAKQKRPEFDCAEFRPGSEASETQMKFGNELGDDHPTSLLSADNLYNVDLDDYSTNDCDVVDIPGRLGDGLVHGFPTSAFDPKNISTASVVDKTFDSEFDRALSLGIIDEYGQLLGKYSEFDTHVWLRLT